MSSPSAVPQACAPSKGPSPAANRGAWEHRESGGAWHEVHSGWGAWCGAQCTVPGWHSTVPSVGWSVQGAHSAQCGVISAGCLQCPVWGGLVQGAWHSAHGAGHSVSWHSVSGVVPQCPAWCVLAWCVLAQCVGQGATLSRMVCPGTVCPGGAAVPGMVCPGTMCGTWCHIAQYGVSWQCVGALLQCPARCVLAVSGWVLQCPALCVLAQ